MRRIQEHFRRIGREPTDIELQSLGQAWSEHCCYKSSKVFLKEFIFPVQAPYVIDRGDAGVVEFDEDHAYALRIESHNHPSAIEPYGGANTGIGGIDRKSTRLNSSHRCISYAVFCLKKKKKK